MTSRVPILVTIIGATGTGKSKLAIQLAQKYIGEIISADSMQVYKGLDVITAKVTKEEQSMAPHHMIDIIDPLSTFTVVDFRNRSLPIIENLLSDDKMPIIVGGTNYYIESLLWQILVEDPISSNNSNKSSVDKDKKSVSENLIFQRDDGYVKLFDNENNSSNHNDNDVNIFSQIVNDSKDNCNKEEDDDDDDDDDDDQIPPFKKVKFDDPITNQELHNKLKEVDPESAARLHPNNRRKIMRSLQVYEQLGIKHSKILRDQRLAGGSGLGGPLRFDNSLIFWLQCDQKSLDERLNVRVDTMIECGLVQELLDFHERYNEERLKSNTSPDYTKGIFQSIGFKEFHDYLILDNEDKNSTKGKKLLEEGITNLKLRTRRYARKQNRWVNNRLIKRSDRQVPPVYSLDTTDLNKWDDNVFGLAVSIIDEKLSGQTISYKSLNNNNNNNNYCNDDGDDDDDRLDEKSNKSNNETVKNKSSSSSSSSSSVFNNKYDNDNEQTNFCETCERIFVGKFQWQAHLDGRKHKKMLNRKNNKK